MTKCKKNSKTLKRRREGGKSGFNEQFDRRPKIFILDTFKK